jgi:hypothetical protein
MHYFLDLFTEWQKIPYAFAKIANNISNIQQQDILWKWFRPACFKVHILSLFIV